MVIGDRLTIGTSGKMNTVQVEEGEHQKPLTVRHGFKLQFQAQRGLGQDTCAETETEKIRTITTS